MSYITGQLTESEENRSNIVKLAQKYRQALAASDNKHEATLLFVESYIDELSQFTLDEQQEFIRLAEADPRWWISLNSQWLSPVKLEL